MAHPRMTAAMTTSSSLGRPTARRYRNRFACAPPHERCRPGARSLRPTRRLVEGADHRRANGHLGTVVAGRQVPTGAGSERNWPAMGECPVPPPQIGGKRTAGCPRDGAWICPFPRQGGEVDRPLLPAPRTAPLGRGWSAGPWLSGTRGGAASRITAHPAAQPTGRDPSCATGRRSRGVRAVDDSHPGTVIGRRYGAGPTRRCRSADPMRGGRWCLTMCDAWTGYSVVGR